MYGEVYVPYTPISGRTMSRMSNNDGTITGSSGRFDSDGTATGTHVSWEYPGGISGAGHWGYLVNRNEVFRDENMEILLEDEKIEEGNTVAFINELVGAYVTRVLNNDGEDGYDYTAFRQAFPGCSYTYN